MNKTVKKAAVGMLSQAEIESYKKNSLRFLNMGKKNALIIKVSLGKVKRTRARNLSNRLIKYIDDAL